MKTRERILQASLQLFNEHGEPRITTNHIADEIDISPGNLYYHFRNKDEIIYLLFQQLEKKIEEVLETPQRRKINIEDMWFALHLVFETIWQYRFFFRDLNNIVSRNKKLRVRYRRILRNTTQNNIAICKGLVASGAMDAGNEEIEALANNIAVIATYWLNFESIRNEQVDSRGDHLAQGVYQVMSLISPFLRGKARELLTKISHDYLT